MHKGGIFLVTGAVLACTACLGGPGKLEIRSSDSGLQAGNQPVPFRIAEARGRPHRIDVVKRPCLTGKCAHHARGRDLSHRVVERL